MEQLQGVKRFFAIGLCLYLPVMAAETVAWRVPVELVVEKGKDHPEVSRLDHMPAESKFFNAGDDLWDLSKAIRGASFQMETYDPDADPFAPAHEWGDERPRGEEGETIPFTGDFVVWNETTKRIVARGEASDLALIETAVDFDSRPKQARVAICVKRGDESRTFSITSRSGEMAKGKSVDGIGVQIAPNLSQDGKIMDVNLAVDLTKEDHKTSINTAVTVKSGDTVRLATWKEGDKDREATLTATTFTAWGVALAEVREVEEAGDIKADKDPDDWDIDGKKIGENLFARIFNVPPDFAQRCGARSALPAMVVPEKLQGLVARGYGDASPILKVHGIAFKDPLAIAGLRPAMGRLLVINTQENLDLVEQIVCSGCGSPSQVDVSFDWEGGAMSLIARSGEKATLSVGTKEKTEELEIAPNIGSDDKWVDLMFHLEGVAGLSRYGTAVTVRSGIAQPVGGDEKNTIRVTAVVRPMEED